jgi:hypothetical protein
MPQAMFCLAAQNGLPPPASLPRTCFKRPHSTQSISIVGAKQSTCLCFCDHMPTTCRVLQVERRIDENDMMVVQLRDAIDVDKTLSRQTGALKFSLLPQQQRGATALSCERFLAANGTIAPPCSAFFHSQGCSPAPNAAAKRLAKLFWRSPAHARPQRPWESEEDNLLKYGIVQTVLAARRFEAASDFQARMAALQGEGDALEEQRRALVEESREARSNLGVLEAEATGSGEAAVLRKAESFSLQQWHAVSYHIPGRCASSIGQCNNKS